MLHRCEQYTRKMEQRRIRISGASLRRRDVSYIHLTPEGTACEKDVESSKSLECLKNDEELSGGEVVMGGHVGVVKQREGYS